MHALIEEHKRDDNDQETGRGGENEKNEKHNLEITNQLITHTYIHWHCFSNAKNAALPCHTTYNVQTK